MDGVKTAEASYRQGIATATYDPDRVTVSDLIAVIETQTYYTAEVAGPNVPNASASADEPSAAAQTTARAVIRVDGLADSRQASQIFARVGRPGILAAASDLEAETLTFDYDPAAVRALELLAAVQEASDLPVTLLSDAGPPGSDGATGAERGWTAAKYAAWGAIALVVAVVVVSAGRWVWRRAAVGSVSPTFGRHATSRAARRRKRRGRR